MTAHSPTLTRSVVIGAELDERLVEAAREDHRSVSSAVRSAVAAWLASRETVSLDEHRKLADALGKAIAEAGPIETARVLADVVEASK